MQESSGKAGALTPAEGWEAYTRRWTGLEARFTSPGPGDTAPLGRDSVAGNDEYAIETFAGDFISRNPWAIARCGGFW